MEACIICPLKDISVKRGHLFIGPVQLQTHICMCSYFDSRACNMTTENGVTNNTSQHVVIACHASPITCAVLLCALVLSSSCSNTSMLQLTLNHPSVKRSKKSQRCVESRLLCHWRSYHNI